MNEHREGRPRQPDLGNRDQVRRLRRGMERSATEVVRCQNCGHQQQADAAMIGPLTTCEKCETALHSCKHCVHFDSSTLKQCRQTIEEAITNKWAANECVHYRTRLVLDSTGKRHKGRSATNNKSAFDSLFKD